MDLPIKKDVIYKAKDSDVCCLFVRNNTDASIKLLLWNNENLIYNDVRAENGYGTYTIDVNKGDQVFAQASGKLEFRIV